MTPCLVDHGERHGVDRRVRPRRRRRLDLEAEGGERQVVVAQVEFKSNVVPSSVETIGALNTGFETVNLHRPTRLALVMSATEVVEASQEGHSEQALDRDRSVTNYNFECECSYRRAQEEEEEVIQRRSSACSQ